MDPTVTDEQLHAMWYACSAVAGEPNGQSACRRLSERLADIIGAPTAIFRREVSPWRLVASSPGAKDAGPRAVPPEGTELDHLIPAPASYLPLTSHHGATRWTPVPLDVDSPSQSLLLLPGDWRTGPAALWLPRFARTASMALRLVSMRQTARRFQKLADRAEALTRRLGPITGERLLHQTIIENAAQATNARLASLSLFQPKTGAIVVRATYGYPSEAVDRVRIAPGSGIVGGVFSSRKPLLVRDTTRVPGLSPRSRRYQTASFMAVPIVSGEESVGVLTLADRTDGRPFTRSDLAACRMVAAVSALALMRQQASRLAEDLAHAAAIDPLTGLFNRRYLQTRLDTELERGRRTGQPVALLMIDVDTFKPVNDLMGHQAGDIVLRQIADLIRGSVRASDVSTRYGGDEFAVIVAENAPSAAQTAERIRQRVEGYRWESLGVRQPFHTTVSIGIAIGEPGESSESLIGRADQQMYRAKGLGRNRVYPPQP